MYIKSNRKFIFVTVVVVALAFAMLFVGLNPSLEAVALDEEGEVVTELMGSGTSENAPFFINSVEEFVFFAEQVNAGGVQDGVAYGTAWYRLGADLDLDGTDILPIGTENNPFDGKFDGNGKIISNYSLTATSGTAGLFGYVGISGEITKLGVYDAKIDGDIYSTVGGLVGINKGKIESSFFNGTVSGYSEIGGLVGVNDGIIRFSFASGEATASALNSYVGGLVGKNSGTLAHSYSIAEVSSQNAYALNIGGVIGGRTSDTGTPFLSYFDNSFASYGGKIKAIGGGANDSYDKTAVEISSSANSVKGITDVELNSADLNDLFGATIVSQRKWVRMYSVDNHTAYAGPVIYDFRDSDNQTAIQSSVTVCKFDKDVTSEFQWGSEQNPYVIKTETQFAYLAEAVNTYKETYVGEYFALGADITFASKQTPIGDVDSDTAFRGVFDGKYHKLDSYKNVSESGDTSYVGIFGYIRDGAEIKNLTISSNCVITGTEYVGSLVGYSENGKIYNVETRATVSSFGNSGGVVGCVNRGTYQNILSAVTFVALGTSTNMYGISGGYREANATTVSNAWYFTSLTQKDGTENPFVLTGDVGNALCYDSRHGTITAVKSADGKISFNCTSIDDGFTVEYRYKDEGIVYKESNDYAPEQEAGIYGTVYARFVKTLEYSCEDKTSVTLPDASTFASTYYVGQKITFPVIVKDGAYIAQIIARDDSGKTITLTKEQYSYEAERTAVVLDTEMTAELSSLEVKVGSINWDSDVFSSKVEYSGNAVEFPTSKLSKPDGYGVSVIYNGGRAPVDANVSDREQYTLVVVYSNKDGIRMGSRQVNFRIEPKPLTITYNLGTLTDTKEWDNSYDALPAEVRQSDVNGIVESDKDYVVVEATMKFDTLDITDKANVTYTFTLSGEKKTNYKAPEDYVGNGAIVKRNVTVSFVSGYEGEYAGTGIMPGLSSHALNFEGLVGSTDVRLYASFSFNPIDGQVMGDVGEYELRVSIDSASGSADKYYNLTFKEAEEGNDYVVYKVNPKEVNVQYDGILRSDGKNLVYDGNEHIVEASFTDIDGKTQKLSLNGKMLTPEEKDGVTAMQGAGTYSFEVIGFTDGNYKLVNPTVEVVVEKAEQSAITLDCVNEVSFGLTVTVTATGGNTDGNEPDRYTYEVKDGYSDVGSFEGNVLSFSKAGKIEIIVTKCETSNYKAVSAEATIIINKAKMTLVVCDKTIAYGESPEFTVRYGDSTEVPSGTSGIIVLVDGVKHEEDSIYSAGDHTLGLDLSDAVSDGYTFEVGENGTLSVSKLAITVTADNVSSVYGGELAELTFTTSPEATLRGTLACETEVKVGTYAISVGSLEEENPDYEITFVSGTYEITPATLTVKVTPQTKKYGELDPEIAYMVEGLANGDTVESIELQVSLTRIEGENAYIGTSTVGYATYEYINKGISHSSENYLATVKFETSGLKITRALPETTDNITVNADPGTLLSEIAVPELEFYGAKETTLKGTLAWANDETLDFKESENLTCKVVFSPEDPNYDECEADVTVKVNPIRITVSFSGSGTSYDGSVHKDDVKYSFRGLRENDTEEDLGVIKTYDGDFIGAGTHTLKIAISNKNYVLGGSTSYNFKIKKAELNISIEDIEAVEGSEFRAEFYYEGFCAGDGEDDLKVKPSVDLPSVAGTYKVTPYGAKDDNYDFVYLDATVKIYAPQISSSGEEDGEIGATFDGRFDSETVITVKDADTSRILTAFNDAKSAYTTLEDKSAYKYYNIKYSVGDSEITPNGEIYLTFTLPEDAGNTEELAFFTVSRSGELVYVRDVVIDGDDVKINVTGASGVVIARTAEAGSQMYIIVIVVAVVVIVLIILISVRVKKKKEKRYIKYRD